MSEIKRVSNRRLPLPRIPINIGALMDIPTALILTGARGETIFLGGLPNIQGVMGAPNTYKTSISLYMLLQAANRVAYSYFSDIGMYDAETTLTQSRVNQLAENMEYLDRDENGVIVTLDNVTSHYADEWFDNVYAAGNKEKLKTKGNLVEYESILGPDKKPIKKHIPHFTLQDSLSASKPKSSFETAEKNGIMDKSNNTMGMKENGFRSRIIGMLPRETTLVNNYIIMTAHVGRAIIISDGPMSAPPVKQLTSMSATEKLKNIPENFTTLTASLWQTTRSRPLKNSGTKLSEYPKYSDDTLENELYIVTLKQHRGKSNVSNTTIELVVSQQDGVLEDITNFHHIKENDRFGIGGTLQSYFIVLYPDVKLGRTTVRSKLKEHKKLARAVEICSNMVQLKQYMSEKIRVFDLWCTPLELYNDLKEMGYDWDKILETRGWSTIKDYSVDTYYLHTYDLLRMRKGLYKPYFNDKLLTKKVKT